MKKSFVLAQTGVVAATVLLVIEYWFALDNAWIFFLFLPGILWVFAQRWNLSFVDALMLVVYTFAAAAGILLGSPSFMALVCILAALCAWQFALLSRRLRLSQNPGIERLLFNRHLTRLSILVGLSLLAAVFAQLVRLELRFSLVLGLGILVVVALSQLISYLYRESTR